MFVVALAILGVIWFLVGTRLPSAENQPLGCVGTIIDAGVARCVQAKEVLRDCGNCPEVVVMPAGKFWMGTRDSAKTTEGASAPERIVSVRAFAAGRYEVTFEEWDECAQQGACRYSPPAKWGRGRQPVTHVSWQDAQNYLRWLTSRAGTPYRLLTEAEWEYLARDGRQEAYTFGSDTRFLCEHGNGADPRSEFPWRNKLCADQTRDRYPDRTAPIGSFLPSTYGLFDLHGNVAEWVQDCWHPDFRGAPMTAVAWLQNDGGDCTRRVVRGGSWKSSPAAMASFARDAGNIASRDADYIGFRVARDLTMQQ